MDVSCWYLQVISGPQGMDKNRSCFFVFCNDDCSKSCAKVQQNMDISKYQTQKDQKGLCGNKNNAVILQAEK
jgi:hypothetical protein